MATWPAMNPDWEYKHWGNEEIFGRKWKNQHLIDHYKSMADEAVDSNTFQSARGATFTGEKAVLFAWHILADIVRYEILYEYGGFMPGADSACVRPLTANADWLDSDLYTVNTGHLFADNLAKLDPKDPRYELLKARYDPDNTSPILACTKGNEWMAKIIEELGKVTELGEAVDTTGNVFMGRMLKKYPAENVKIKLYYPEGDRRREHQSECSAHYSGTTKARYHLGR